MPRWWISIVCSGLAGAACGEGDQPGTGEEQMGTAAVQEAEPRTLLFESSTHRLYLQRAENDLRFTVTTQDERVLAEELDLDELDAAYPVLFSEWIRPALERAKPRQTAAAAVVPDGLLPLEESESLFGLETRNHVLFIHSTELGTLYTVESKDGRVLAEGLTETELGIRYPELHAIVLGGVDLIATGADETYR